MWPNFGIVTINRGKLIGIETESRQNTRTTTRCTITRNCGNVIIIKNPGRSGIIYTNKFRESSLQIREHFYLS